jgi:hypothetical protein
MKIKSGFMTRNISGKIVAVAVGPRSLEFNGMINLNETGEFIWKCLEKETSEQEIAQKLAKHYDIDTEKALESTKSFIDELRKNDLIDE